MISKRFMFQNKTLLKEETPVNRINVRRLMIRIKDLVLTAARQLIFEQNDNTMTREEEIRQNAKNKYPYIKGLPQTAAHQDIFIEGAKWADSNPQENLIDIEKACNWLKDRISIPYEGNYNENGEPFAGDYINFAMERLKRAEEFCEEFKNAMKQ